MMSAQLSQLRRDPECARTQAEAAIAVSREHGLDAVELWCLLPRGWALAEQGEVTKGIADIREGMERRRAHGIGAVWPWFFALLAEAYGKVGQLGEGLTALQEALQWVQRNDERLYEAEVYRIRGELLLKQDVPDTAEAEQCFQRALQVARQQQAKSWELRAATSLSRLWQLEGKRGDARELLMPVYTWFTEGFDTADLQDARVLADRLS
jgi:predicted ATPase